MGRRIAAGTEPAHSFVLACLFADLCRRGMPSGESLDLLAELRSRGFARGDTERMRLVLEALPHLVTPSRRTRRLIQRPYFDEARNVFEITAPAAGGDPEILASFLRDPEAWLESRSDERRRVEPPREPGGGSPPEGGGGGRRRRRGRRGGRSRRRRRGGGAAAHPLDAAHGEPRAYGEGEERAKAIHAEAADSADARGTFEESPRPSDPSNRFRT
jgi:hypothetical protein